MIVTIIIVRLGLTPWGLTTGSSRVLRGAHFGHDAWGLRSALRYAYSPGTRSAYGVRLVRIR